MNPAGAWTAFAGLCLQLAGIIWDTLLHHNDPGLAVRESVVSLTNPSHLLMAAGITLTAIGVGVGLYHLAGSRSGISTRAAVAIVALLTLWLGTMTVTLRTGGVSGKHDHDDPDAAEPGGAARELR